MASSGWQPAFQVDRQGVRAMVYTQHSDVTRLHVSTLTLILQVDTSGAWPMVSHMVHNFLSLHHVLDTTLAFPPSFIESKFHICIITDQMFVSPPKFTPQRGGIWRRGLGEVIRA